MRMKMFLALLAMLTPVVARAQVSQEWAVLYDAGGEEVFYSMAVDSSGNVYVTGYQRPGGYGTGDIVTVKYGPNGDSLWVRTYNGPGDGDDIAYALERDTAGNLYVTGESVGDGTGPDYVTIKYDSDGALQWVRRYDGPVSGFDVARDLALDAQGNIYVTGESAGLWDAFDYLTIKYAGNGDVQWAVRDSCRSGGQDFAKAVAVNQAASRVYVTGTSIGLGPPYTGFDIYTAGYEAARPDTAPSGWFGARYDGPADAADEARAVAVDGSGNVCVTGFVDDGPSTTEDYATLKYGADLALLWARVYDGPGGADDIPEALAVDGSGNVCVTGWSIGGTDPGGDIGTIKYSSGGLEEWVARYDSDAGDVGTALALGNDGSVYVTGMSGFFATLATVKYSPDGVEQWAMLSATSGNGRDIEVDGSGSVFVTANTAGLDPDGLTIKYTQGTTAVGSEIPEAGAVGHLQSWPNPFGSGLAVSFTLARSEFVRLRVFDLQGRQVATLVSEVLPAGAHVRRWEAAGGADAPASATALPSGIYPIRLEAGRVVRTLKAVHLR